MDERNDHLERSFKPQVHLDNGLLSAEENDGEHESVDKISLQDQDHQVADDIGNVVKHLNLNDHEASIESNINESIQDVVESVDQSSLNAEDKVVDVVDNILEKQNDTEVKLNHNKSLNNMPRRSSLSEDSKLVKFSLPSNSINLIQSNTQFLNKSRNFLNFITEKSTNIMEKALLPPNLAMKYQYVDKKNPQFELNNKVLIKNNEINNTIYNNIIKNESETVEINNDNLIDDNNDDVNNVNIDLKELLNELKHIKNEKLILEDKLNELKLKNNEYINDNNLSEIENREKVVERLTNELRLALINVDTLKKERDNANNERENMVMKYAIGEKQLIDVQKSKDTIERKMKELMKDNELLQNKLKQSQNERSRICSILDTKCRNLIDTQKELEKLKEDMDVRDVKFKWTQSKLKSEMEIHKDTQLKLDKALQKINEMKDECEQVRKESQNTIKKFQISEENKAVTLDQQLKEQQARLILERHVTEDKESSRIQLQKEVELLKNRQQILIEENNTLSLKIQDLEKNHLNYENNLSNLKMIADQRQKEIVELTSKVSHLETLKVQLLHKEQCLLSNESELERLRLVNKELQDDMDCCRQREAHMLDFTQKLTDKNVRLQSEFTSTEAKINHLENEQGPLRECIVKLKAQVKSLEDNLISEKNKRTEECEILAKHLAEQTQLVENLTQMLEDSKGENDVLRRKQQLSIKEMSRELNQLRKKLESYENKSHDNLNSTSRTPSNTSLNTGDSTSTNGLPQLNGESLVPDNDLDKNSLMEKILKMQSINVKRAEKIDFLEEHTRTLVAELQKKTKIIQHYIFHDNFDAMGNNERDRYKAELMKHGGIMASIYNHKVSDGHMTLELSLEINQKLQTVLEDALLKNITLKDNIDTLGEEIARLTMKHQS